ncbi:hypothetical protein [Congregibacter sp.]|uniref:hypothetical protein n=1 Tax=Congregibacter sp. TaxID=2744308 RepID=UPI003F6C9F7C
MSRALQILSVLLIAGCALFAYFLTLAPTQDDPCLNPQNDVSAAILGDDRDQDALANRAMLQRKLCEDSKRTR